MKTTVKKPELTDELVGSICIVLKKLGLTMHVRGTDLRPVVELRHKGSRRIVGGIELKRLCKREGLLL